jgi:hypothetical protein
MLQQLLEKIALTLESRGISYMVIGGQAALLYGEARLTKDIDVTLGVGPDRWEEITGLVKHAGWEVLAGKDFSERTMVLPCVHRASGIRLDLIFSHSVYELQAMERVRRVEVGKALVRFAAVEDLVIHKVVAGRPRDLEDVWSILAKNPALDVAYIRRWLAEFDSSLKGDFSERFETIRRASARK